MYVKYIYIGLFCVNVVSSAYVLVLYWKGKWWVEGVREHPPSRGGVLQCMHMQCVHMYCPFLHVRHFQKWDTPSNSFAHVMLVSFSHMLGSFAHICWPLLHTCCLFCMYVASSLFQIVSGLFWHLFVGLFGHFLVGLFCIYAGLLWIYAVSFQTLQHTATQLQQTATHCNTTRLFEVISGLFFWHLCAGLFGHLFVGLFCIYAGLFCIYKKMCVCVCVLESCLFKKPDFLKSFQASSFGIYLWVSFGIYLWVSFAYMLVSFG